MKGTTKVTIYAILGLSILLVASSLLVRQSDAAPAPDLLPDIRPVEKDLLDHDIVRDPTTGHILLRFGGAGKSVV